MLIDETELEQWLQRSECEEVQPVRRRAVVQEHDFTPPGLDVRMQLNPHAERRLRRIPVIEPAAETEP